MLSRTKVRHYVLGILLSEEVPQGLIDSGEGVLDCELGPLFVNCDGSAVKVQDSFTHQALDDFAGNIPVNDQENSFITFNVTRVSYVHDVEHFINKSSITLQISIYLKNSDSELRQDDLDKIEE